MKAIARTVRLPLSVIAGALIVASFCVAGGPVFDVASVKISPPDAPRPWRMTGGPGTADTGRFRANHIPMAVLIQKAYGVQLDEIDGPPWIKDSPPSVFYNITATMPPDTQPGQFRLMLQNLLLDRFQMTIHREVRRFPGYELTIDKGGPKFKEVTIDEEVSGDPRAGARRGPDGFPIVAGPMLITLGTGTDYQRIKVQQRSFSDFVERLGGLIASSQGLRLGAGSSAPRVVDKTGLAGNYTFTLEYSCPPCDTRPDSAANAGPGVPELFQAIQKQLGLRLEKRGAVSVNVVVVDKAGKTPRPD